MIPREILKKIRQIELRTNRLVTETLGGQYHSVFKGQGMNFDEVREYQPGDDVRAIEVIAQASRELDDHARRDGEHDERTFRDRGELGRTLTYGELGRRAAAMRVWMAAGATLRSASVS